MYQKVQIQEVQKDQENISESLILKCIEKFSKVVKEEILKRINNISDNIKELKDKIEILERDEIIKYI